MTNASGGGVDRTRHYPYGEIRWTNANPSPTDYDFTGQRREASFGLLDYNARYYDPLIGRFISADTVVPDFADPQNLNRYSYVLGNPLRYVDPTGYFTQDEIMTSLIDQYGETEAQQIWDLWQADPAFIEALNEAEFGHGVWASDMWLDGPAPGHGIFEEGENGRINIFWSYADRAGQNQVTLLELYQLQGQGGYQVDKGAGNIWSSCSDNCIHLQGHYNYVDGIPYSSIDGGPRYTTMVLWDRSLAGLNERDFGINWPGYDQVFRVPINWHNEPTFGNTAMDIMVGLAHTALGPIRSLRNWAYKPGVSVIDLD